jgi:hypothetical protein
MVLKDSLKEFKQTLTEMKSLPHNLAIKANINTLDLIYKAIKVSAKKIDNSSKFINFFAHDILDYS